MQILRRTAEILGAQLKILGAQLIMLGASVSKEKVKSWIVPRLFDFHLQFVTFVMFSGKQTTARKMADQLKNCINQRAHGFYSNRIHTAGSVWITDTITIVMIHYNNFYLSPVIDKTQPIC